MSILKEILRQLAGQPVVQQPPRPRYRYSGGRPQPHPPRQPGLWANHILCIDASGSMQPKMKALSEGINLWWMHVASRYPRDLIGCVVYADRASVLFPLTRPTNKRALHKFNQIRLGGYTNITAGVELSIDLLMRAERRYRRLMTLMTDGQANVDTTRLIPRCHKAKHLNIKINTVGFGAKPSDYDADLLKRISSITGGSYTHINSLKLNADQIARYLIRHSR